MSEPYWSALGARAGAGGVDYEGVWSAGTAYVAGDVVAHNGIAYLAVNPSTGVDPGVATLGVLAPLVTTLPASPVDGQEVILTDSLTTPSYTWHLRYVAGATGTSYKWLFIGGPPLITGVKPSGTLTTVGSAVDATNPGPAFIAPRAGVYALTFCGAAGKSVVDSNVQFQVGTVGIPNTLQAIGAIYVANYLTQLAGEGQIVLGAGEEVKMRYYQTTAGTLTVYDRVIFVTPVRLA